jgi:hypothetical protein
MRGAVVPFESIIVNVPQANAAEYRARRARAAVGRRPVHM